MSLLWIVPPVVLLVGLAVVFTVLRSIDQASAAVRLQVVRVDDVRTATAAARMEAARARASLDQLHRR